MDRKTDRHRDIHTYRQTDRTKLSYRLLSKSDLRPLKISNALRKFEFSLTTISYVLQKMYQILCNVVKILMCPSIIFNR